MDTKEVNSVNTPLIVSDGCCVHFGDAPALEGVNFSINRGRKVAVVGPNGGGKSTLFNALSLFNRKKINDKIKKALQDVGLEEKINDNIKSLSGGQLQRVLIARALAQDSEILLLDEAFSAVDIGAQEDIMQLINSINLDGKTILIATHDVNNLEEKFDEVLCLNKHCCAYGDPSEVLTPEVIEEMYGSHTELFMNKSHFKTEGNNSND